MNGTADAAPVAVRPGRPGDLDQLVEIENASFASDRLSRRNLAHGVVAPASVLLAAETEGRLVGYGLMQTRRGSRKARITSLACLPGRPKGAGRALMDALAQAARARGCDTIRLEVRADNPRAVELYKRLGYRQIGLYRDYYEDGQIALRFEANI